MEQEKKEMKELSSKTPKKITIDDKAYTIHKSYRKQYTQKSLNTKLLKKIYIPDDKDFVSRFFKKTSDEKNAPVIFLHQNIQSKKDLKRLTLIAKEVAKQKNRIRFVHIMIALALVCALMLFVYLLRNTISRKIIITASERSFGAQCEIEAVDLNLFDTHLYIKNYRVANKNAPMYNLFEIGLIDIHFNLLELSRRKLVCKNIAIEDITWNTKRTRSGALSTPPPESENSNQVLALLKKEINKIRSEVSVSRGLSAVKNQLDPRLIFEREKSQFTTPTIAKEIIDTVPNFTQKWQTRAQKTKKQVEKTIEVGKSLIAIDVEGIDSLPKLRKTLGTIQRAIQTVEENTTMTKELVRSIESDAHRVERLLQSAHTALKHDTKRIKKITDTIRSFNIDAGSRFISSLFDSFVINTLGKIYPYVSFAIEKLEATQENSKQEAKTIKDKVKKLERLPGKTFIFEQHPLPSLVFHSVSLSGHDPDNILNVEGSVKNVSNNADQLGLPIMLNVSTAHDTMKEAFDGIIDLRTASKELVDGTISVMGVALAIPSTTDGVPSLNGRTEFALNLNVKKNKDFSIGGNIVTRDVSLSLQTFEPKLVHTIYSNVLSNINTIDLALDLNVIDAQHFKMNITSDIDKQIARALEKELNAQIARIKKEVEKQCRVFLNGISKEYQPIVKEFSDIVQEVHLNEKNLSSVERVLKKKEREIQKRIAQYGKKTIKNALKDLF